MTKRQGRPPTHESGAMATLRVRVPQWMLDYLDSKGKRSEVLRGIIAQAKENDIVQYCEAQRLAPFETEAGT